MAEDKHYFYFVSKFAQKNNSIFIVHVLLKSKHYVILFSFSKWPKNGTAFDAAQPEKTKYFVGPMLEKRV